MPTDAQMAFDFEAAGRGADWFSAQLFRLILKADWENIERLRFAFPAEVDFVERWRYSDPGWLRTLLEEQ